MSKPRLERASLEVMFAAVEAVEERLRRSVAALEAAAVPYTVIGAHAVAYWVAQKDDGAQRNTPNVDLLVRPADADRARTALEAIGFVHAGSGGPPAEFLDGPDGKPRQAVRVWFSGAVVTPVTEPLPDLACGIAGPRFRVVPLETLVRMKLSAFRTIDCVHLRDLIGVGQIDTSWPERFPEPLAARLREILADPDG